ncbi:hypothetical protein D3C80_1729720 [compost metagenome]
MAALQTLAGKFVHLTVGKKLGLGFGLMLLLTAIIAAPKVPAVKAAAATAQDSWTTF